MKKNFFSIREGDLSKINIEEILKEESCRSYTRSRRLKNLQKENFIKRFENSISAVVIMAGGR